MDKKEIFADTLMNKVFNFSAPAMPDFKQIKQDDTVEELDSEQLDYLAAAGQIEISINRKTAKK
jgi:hypothetical protein